MAGVTPIADVPDAPTIGAATNVGTSRAYNNGSATVAYTAAPTGGTATTFTATSTPGSFTGTGTSPITVTGLQSATSYTFTVTPTNSTATGPASSSSSSITATTVPQAPTIGTVTRTSDTVVSVPFTAGATGGSSITSYTIVSSPSISLSYSGTTSPIAVTGTFAASTAYTFTIAAVNANGTSTASSASNSVTPKQPFALLAHNGFGNTTYISKSTDGMATWSNLSIPPTGANDSANGTTLSTNGTGTWTISGSIFTINQAGIWYSTNSGATWTAVAVTIPNGDGTTRYNLIYSSGEGYGNNYFVVGGARRAGQPAFIGYASASNLASWSFANTGTGTNLGTNTVIYGSNMSKWWTTIEGGKTIYSSSNPPTSWTVTTGSIYNQSLVATDGTTVVWAGQQQYADQQYATGSATTATAFTTLDYGARAVAYGNGKFMMAFTREPNNPSASTTSLIYTSTSGTGSWSSSTSPWGATTSIQGGGWAGKFFIANTAGVYATSTDAVTWTIIGTTPGYADGYSTVKYGL